MTRSKIRIKNLLVTCFTALLIASATSLFWTSSRSDYALIPRLGYGD